MNLALASTPNNVATPFQNKPVILVAHQFAGDALANFNATVRQLKVSFYEKAFISNLSPAVLALL